MAEGAPGTGAMVTRVSDNTMEPGAVSPLVSGISQANMRSTDRDGRRRLGIPAGPFNYTT